jgi:hypothetical protein
VATITLFTVGGLLFGVILGLGSSAVANALGDLCLHKQNTVSKIAFIASLFVPLFSIVPFIFLVEFASYGLAVYIHYPQLRTLP